MKKTVSFLLLAAISAGISVVSAEENSFDRELSLWRKSSPRQVFVDRDCKAAGESSIRIEKGGTFSRVFELKPETEYELTFYVKGKDIESGKNLGGRIMLFDGKKKWGRITSGTMGRGTLETGTFDWRLGKGRIKSSDWGKTIKIDLTLRGKGTIWYDEVQLREAGKAEENASFRRTFTDGFQQLALVPQGCFGFFDPGEKVTFRIYSQSKSNDLEYSLNVKDETGKTVFSIPRRKLEERFEIPGQGCGYYVVEADFYADGKKARSLQSAFAVARPFGKRDPFFQMGFGVNQKFFDGFKRIGVGTICLKLTWKNFKSTPEKMWDYNYNVTFKRFFESDDFELVGCIGCSLPRREMNLEKLAEGYPMLTWEVLDFRRKYIDLALKAANGKIKTWQFQNEIPSSATMKSKYIGTWSEAMANFMVMARSGSRQIRKALPGAKIRAGGNNVQKYLQTVEPIVMGDLVNDFDQYIIDAYTGNWDLGKGKPTIPEISLMSFYQEASRLAESLGKGKNIGNAETGYSIPYGAPFDRGLAIDQAELTARVIIISKAGPVDFFEVHKPGSIYPGPKELKDSSACMNTCWKPVWFGKDVYQVPLPGGAMYATAAHELAFVREPSYFSEDLIYGATFAKPDGSALLVLWNIEKSSPFTFVFPSETRMVNMYGRETVLPAGRQTLTLSPAPVYLTVKMPVKQLTEQVKAALVRQSPKFRCAGYFIGRDTAKIFIRNLGRTTRKGTVQGQKVTLLPDQTAALTVKTMSGKATFQADDGSRIEIVPAPGSFQTVQRVKAKPVFDGTGNWVRNLKKGTLSYPDDIRPQSALQKELCYFKTSFNPDGHNVSADYWLACDDENFYLAAEVDDPVHLQRHRGADLWRDDSVQFVFAVGHPVPAELNHPTEPVQRSPLNFGAALTSSGPELVKYLGDDRGKKVYPINITRRNNRTFYEICIPFKALGGRPDRFGFVIFDNNYVTKKTAPYMLQFSPGVVGKADPAGLKQLHYPAAE